MATSTAYSRHRAQPAPSSAAYCSLAGLLKDCEIVEVKLKKASGLIADYAKPIYADRAGQVARWIEDIKFGDVKLGLERAEHIAEGLREFERMADTVLNASSR